MVASMSKLSALLEHRVTGNADGESRATVPLRLALNELNELDGR